MVLENKYIYKKREEKKKNQLTFLPVRPGGLEAHSTLACSLLSLFALGHRATPGVATSRPRLDQRLGLEDTLSVTILLKSP
jgi:hypothetical protein